MGIPNPILYFPSNHSLTTNVQFPCLWTDLTIFFSLTWKFDGDSKSDIVLSPNDSLDHKSPISLFMDRFEKKKFLWLGNSMRIYLKWLTGPQKFVIMIRCKIDFDMIWYSVMFGATLYLSIFIWSSDFLKFVFMNVVIFV